MLKHYGAAETDEFGGACMKAIMDSFPELEWSKDKFEKNRGSWFFLLHVLT